MNKLQKELMKASEKNRMKNDARKWKGKQIKKEVTA